MMQPAGPESEALLQLIYSSLWIMVPVVIAVVVALGLILFRFRWRGEPQRPREWENPRLELLWTIIPFVLLALLAVGTVRESFVVAAPKGKSILQVNVTGHQYWWAFAYPGQGIVTANELHIPVGVKIELNMTSADVMHAFWVPQLGGKEALVPGRTNVMWIEASKPGLYHGQCAEFCGTGHANMRLLVDAQSSGAFKNWVLQMQHPVVKPTTALARTGEKVFATATCSVCHTIGGTAYAGVIGPNLTNLALRPMIAGNILPNNSKDLARWLKDPQAVKPGALMPKLPLSNGEIKALVAFLRSLKTPRPGPKIS